MVVWYHHSMVDVAVIGSEIGRQKEVALSSRSHKDTHTETESPMLLLTESTWTDSIQSMTQPLPNVTQPTQESSAKEPVCSYPLRE